MYHDTQHQSTKLPLFARIGQVAGEGGDLEVPGFRTVCSEWPICGTGYTVKTVSEPPVFKFIRVSPVYSHNYGWETGDLNKPSTTNNHRGLSRLQECWPENRQRLKTYRLKCLPVIHWSALCSCRQAIWTELAPTTTKRSRWAEWPQMMATHAQISINQILMKYLEDHWLKKSCFSSVQPHLELWSSRVWECDAYFDVSHSRDSACLRVSTDSPNSSLWFQ